MSRVWLLALAGCLMSEEVPALLCGDCDPSEGCDDEDPLCKATCFDDTECRGDRHCEGSEGCQP